MVKDHEDDTRERSLINGKNYSLYFCVPVKFQNKVQNIFFFVYNFR
jgi:hypothetical protein